MIYIYVIQKNDELYHHGVLGMKWGVHRYQNSDGTLTNAGKRRRAKYERWQAKKHIKIDEKYDRTDAKESKKYKNKIASATRKKRIDTIEYTHNEKIFVNNALRKLEHTRVNNITENAYYKDRYSRGAIVASHIVAGAFGSVPVAAITSKNIINTSATTRDKREYTRLYNEEME